MADERSPGSRFKKDGRAIASLNDRTGHPTGGETLD